MANIHLILQGKGGVGKSVSAWALAQYLVDRAAQRYWQEKNAGTEKREPQSEDVLSDAEGDVPLGTDFDPEVSYLETPRAPADASTMPLLIDIDPLNSTLASFKDLPVRRFELFKETEDLSERYVVRQEVFDEMMDAIISSKNDVIIDIGSAGFAPFCTYFIDNDLPKFLEDRVPGRKNRVYIHTVIVGGDNFGTTVAGFSDLAAQMPLQHNPAKKTSAPIKFIVWLNPYFGKVELNGNGFEDAAAYQQYKSRIQGIIRMPNTRSKQLFDAAMTACLAHRWTFRQFIEYGLDPKTKSEFHLSTMAVSRIVSIREDFYAEFDAMRIL